ncbi:DUF6266 family protein [Litoribacter populi]|uniref:DUF6266 family protein n=1 Tax=Litoribacter populi TaxID=2598460 RepID=UPI001180103D|nr:DUF6266 family protein [Litoribacter populi]
MGKNIGFTAGFQGKVDGFVYYKVNSVSYVRAKPNKSGGKRPSSQVQKINQSKFGVASTFMKKFAPIVRFGFQNEVLGMRSAINVAVGYAQSNAIIGLTSYYRIDPQRVLVSKGNLEGPMEAKVAWKDDATVFFTWKNNSFMGSAKPIDRVMLVLVHEKENWQEYVLEGNGRLEGAQELKLPYPGKWQGQTYAYIAFSRYSPGKKRYWISNSEYLGMI